MSDRERLLTLRKLFPSHPTLEGMARKRGFRRYIRGNINENMALDTLAGLALLAGSFDETVNERSLVSSVVVAVGVTGQTSTDENDGPIMVGVSHSDYSGAEIEAYIENLGSWNEGDLVNQETSRRKIRKIGVIEWPVATDESHFLFDGAKRKFKLNWILNQGQGLSMWAYNMGTSGLVTGSEVFIEGHANLWPR